MTAAFTIDGYQRVERRAAVIVRTYQITATGMEQRVVEVQPCDVCGALIGPWWDFPVNGEPFTFCSKHKAIGEAADDHNRAARPPAAQGSLFG